MKEDTSAAVQAECPFENVSIETRKFDVAGTEKNEEKAYVSQEAETPASRFWTSPVMKAISNRKPDGLFLLDDDPADKNK